MRKVEVIAMLFAIEKMSVYVCVFKHVLGRGGVCVCSCLCLCVCTPGPEGLH